MAIVPTALDGQNVDVVHREVRSRILRGSIPPGEELSQVRLAKELGVSRTPLREALRLLQREGLVEGEANRQYRVAGFSVRDMEELYIARLTLESAGIRITTPRLAPEEIADLEAELAKMAHFAELKDYERWEVPHRAFHAGLVRHAGTRLTGLLAQLSDHAERYRRLYTIEAPRAWSVGVTAHRGILDAVKAGDVDAAAERLVRHLARTVTSVVEMVEPGYDASRLMTAMSMAMAPLNETGR
jgi:DNA-binding GntR family transcriptional regulator